MTIFGLAERVVARLASGVRGDPESVADLESATDVFARATWTGIAEPGDSTAGLVTSALGPSLALTALLERWSARRWLAAVVEAGVECEQDLGEQLGKACHRWLPRVDSGTATRALEQADRVGARLLLPTDDLWPAGLSDLDVHAPIGLWWRGTCSALQAVQRSIALVGARAATGYGEHVAMEASAGLVDRGFSIVSGAAYGIDGMAHRAALASTGTTIAFLAGGVDRFYPSGHDALLTRIAEKGVVASELPCGSAPTKWRFLQRNRLIAAASGATVVLEAGWRSGSLNTAGHAAALGRPLGAVPGPVTSAASAGCHRLIRDYGAVCVTDARQMAELVGFEAEPIAGATGAISGSGTDTGMDHTANETRILDALSARSARTLEDIVRRSGISSDQARSVLGALNLEGSATERVDGWVRTRVTD